MEIIGTNSNGFILQATADEVTKILGFTYAAQAKDAGFALAVGSVIPISDIYSRLSSMRSNDTALADARKSLRSLADLLEPIDNAIQEALKPVAVEEAK